MKLITQSQCLASRFGLERTVDILAECGFDERVRGEALTLEQCAALSDVLAKYM